jgi:general transcription factor 3C polypeptide 5 (transcription factor C subunit 1)
MLTVVIVTPEKVFLSRQHRVVAFTVHRLRGTIGFVRMDRAAASMEAGTALVVPPEPLIVIEHPCIVKNTGKAIKSLGGVLLLDQLLNDPRLDKSIEASLRPDDPFAKTIPAGPVSTGNVLLKITVPKLTGRKRKRGSDEPFQYHSSNYSKEPSSNNEGSASVKDNRHERLLRALLDNPTAYTVTPVGSIKETHRFRCK